MAPEFVYLFNYLFIFYYWVTISDVQTCKLNVANLRGLKDL